MDVQAAILAAIGKGAPAYNAGDRRGCYNTYQACAASLARGSSTDPAVGAMLSAALSEASRAPSDDNRAWIMRVALDKCLVCVLLQAAIARGVPAFNSGRPDKCADIYMAAAEEVLRVGGSGEFVPVGIRAALKEARRARERRNDNDAAWALRHAFDAVLEAWLGAGSSSTPPTVEIIGPVRGRRGLANGQLDRVLLSRGEQVSILAGDGSTWVPISGALLDTGNEARTLISPRVVRQLGLRPDKGSSVPIRGITGSGADYPQVRFRMRIGDVETGVVYGAVGGGSTSMIVGRDVLGPLGNLGYTVRQV